MNLRTLLLICITFLNLKGYSLEVQILHPCHFQTLAHQYYSTTQVMTVGQITLQLLSQQSFSYVANEAAVHRILNSPIGNEALDIVNDHTMRAYGWCYLVNGVYSEDFPSQKIVGPYDTITWYFGFALYDKGQWVRQCAPAHEAPPLAFCS
ncbi:MAG: hypothetical protein KDD61_07410 [Bdellovibrionales bacterium]|nr:hypothetical protein [Bdellovibrionales bacterium]